MMRQPSSQDQELLKKYCANPGNKELQQQLNALNILEGELLLKNPEAILEFDWIEGFGATIYTAVTRIDYALHNNLYFTFKKPLGFGHWTDFFQPFWSEEHKKQIYTMGKRIETKNLRLSIYAEHVKNLHTKIPFNLFMQKNYLSIFQKIFVLKDDIQNAIEATIAALNLPKDYIAVHIRRGDRSKHRRCPCCTPAQTYFNEIQKMKLGTNHVFIMSDDQQSIADLAQRIQNVDTLTKEHQKGFNHKEFFATDHTEKFAGFLQLFTEIEIASRAKYFIGTYCSVLSHLIQARHGVKDSTLLY